MAWAGGTYTKGNSATGGWSGDAASSIGIEAGRHDTQDNDFATGINNCLTKDGQNTPTANLPMGGYKHTGVADASASNQYMAFGQISNGTTTANVGALTCTSSIISSANLVKQDQYQFSADSVGSVSRQFKTRGTSATTHVAVQSGDEIGRNDYVVSNGTSYVTAARSGIIAKGLVGSNYPAYFYWQTVGSTGSIANRMYLSEDGELLLGTSTAFGNALITTQKSSGGNRIAAISNSIADTESVAVITRGTVSGVTRDNSLLVYKHSGIVNACAALEMQRQNGTRDLLWNDDSGNFRTSTVVTNIGTTGGTVVGTQTSDERLKNVVGPIENGLDKIALLSPIKFTYKDAPTKDCLGFLAQEAKLVVPESVYDTREPIEGYDPEDTKLAMDYATLIPVLVKACQELKVKCDLLETRLAALENA